MEKEVITTISDEVYFMVDKNDKEAVELMKAAFDDYEIVEEESFAGGAAIIFVVSTVIAFANTKAAKAIIDGLFEKNRMKVEYHGNTIEGSYENVQATIRKIQREERSQGGH